ncbi:hypothetical protein NSERUTF1_3865 [Nocardia seriolae]|nr:hypothetical protein NSERUTF1_3865 [Nocardia seriolae]
MGNGPTSSQSCPASSGLRTHGCARTRTIRTTARGSSQHWISPPKPPATNSPAARPLSARRISNSAPPNTAPSRSGCAPRENGPTVHRAKRRHPARWSPSSRAAIGVRSDHPVPQPGRFRCAGCAYSI